MPDVSAIAARFSAISPFLDERQRRLVAAVEARTLGERSISAVSRATGLSREVIATGLKELQDPTLLPKERIRRAGGGRKPLTTKDPGLADALERLVDPVTRGDPESPLRWTAKSLRRLSKELAEAGHRASPHTVALHVNMSETLAPPRTPEQGIGRTHHVEHRHQHREALRNRGLPSAT